MECTLYTIVGYFSDGTLWRSRHTTSFNDSIELFDNMVNTAKRWLDEGNLRMNGVTVKVFTTDVDFKEDCTNSVTVG